MQKQKLNNFFGQRTGFIVMALCLLSVFGLGHTSLAAYEISDGSVKALYHFNGDSADSSGNAHNGTDSGGITYSAGVLGNGVSCNNGGLITVTDHNDLSPTNGTLCYWEKETVGGAIWNHQYTGGSPYAGLIVNTSDGGAGKVYMQIMAGTGTANPADWTSLTSNSIVSSSWHYFCEQWTGSVLKIWRDGTLDSSMAWAHNEGNPGANLYMCSVGGTYKITGMMDEMALFNTVLSTSTIQALYNSGTGQEICTTAGCGSAGSSSTSTLSTSTDCFLGTDTTDWELLKNAVLWTFYFLFSVVIVSLFWKWISKFKIFTK